MNLPKLNVPTFFLEMPSTGKKHKFRPYLVKEQKILLIALEGENREELINAVNEVINSCVEGVEAEKMPAFDFIYTYLKLYVASNGEAVSLKLPHKDQSECDYVTPVTLSLGDIKVKFNEQHKNKIDLTDEIGVIMKYPTALDLMTTIDEIKTNISTFNQTLIKNCIDVIYDLETVYKLEDFSDEEIMSWYNSLGKMEIKKLQEFFTTMPEAVIEIEFVCPICKKKEQLSVTQFMDFFFYP